MATKPSDASKNKNAPCAATHLNSWGPYPDVTGKIMEYGSYGLNGWVYNLPSTEKNAYYPPEDYWRNFNITQANRVPLMLDCSLRESCPRTGSRAPDNPDEYKIGYEWEMGRFCLDRHSGKVNCVFMDGTVRKVGLKELWTLKWSRTFDTAAGPSRGWPAWMRKFN
jgi:prepilin-type processing-associated H-X9-DG protein